MTGRFVPRRGDVLRSPSGQEYVLDHVERRDDDADRYRLRSVQHGVLLSGRYTVDALNRSLVPTGRTVDLDAEV